LGKTARVGEKKGRLHRERTWVLTYAKSLSKKKKRLKIASPVGQSTGKEDVESGRKKHVGVKL